jgi:peptidoglycan/xylan/chitin deacetylase (PgdA/CDA1 family)
MNNSIRLLTAFLFFIFLSSHCFAAVKNFKWPKGVKTAVSLAYDDSLNSQLDNAIPALNKYQFKGSFYLILSSEVVLNRLPEWRAAAAAGHELGNHTLFHQCSHTPPGRAWVMPHRDLDNISVAQLKDQITVANIMLHAIDGKTERTFTTPCGDLNAGGENYVNTIKSEFVAIKSLMGNSVTPDVRQLDPYAVSILTPADMTGKQLIDIVKAATKKGSMINFTFHGIGGDHLAITNEAHDELLQYLAQHSDIYWVDTFINIMKYVKENQK